MNPHEDPNANGSLDDERAFADDPFGMAAILREHADAGPMPELVARRISAALAAAERERSTQVQPIATAAGSAAVSAGTEAAARVDHLRSVPAAPTPWQPVNTAGATSTTPAGTGHSGGRSRRSRRASALLGIAAATVVIAGGGTLLHTLKGNSNLTTGAAAPAATQDSRLTTERQTEGTSAATQPTDLGLPGPGVAGAASAVQIKLSETNYHGSDLVAEAAGLVDSSTGPDAIPFTLPPNAAESPAVGPIATEIGMRSCVAGLGAINPQSVVADIANFDGQPAVIIVITDHNGTRTAYAAKRSCSQNAPHLLTAPVRVP